MEEEEVARQVSSFLFAPLSCSRKALGCQESWTWGLQAPPNLDKRRVLKEWSNMHGYSSKSFQVSPVSCLSDRGNCCVLHLRIFPTGLLPMSFLLFLLKSCVFPHNFDQGWISSSEASLPTIPPIRGEASGYGVVPLCLTFEFKDHPYLISVSKKERKQQLVLNGHL